jgi:uncharacterized protein (TIGR03435 family)
MRNDSRELLAVGLGGRGSLGNRIELLLKRGREFSPRVSPLRLTASVGCLLMCVAAGSLAPRWIAFAQRLEFEIASVKPHHSGDGRRFIRPSPGRLTIRNLTLKDLLGEANKMRPFQIFGGPDWIDSERFDVEAKAEGNALPQQMTGPMLETLLQDRFKLQSHRESRELPIYVLTVGKNGSHIQPASEKTCVPFDPSNPSLPQAQGRNPSEVCGFIGMGRGSLNANQVTMEALTMAFSQLLGRAVVDKTGITGEVDAHMTFILDQPANPTLPSTATDPGPPSIFTAIQEQLGLKLDSAKGPVEVLVVDHAERPTEN